MPRDDALRHGKPSNEKPTHHNQELSPLSATRESPCSNKDPTQPERNKYKLEKKFQGACSFSLGKCWVRQLLLCKQVKEERRGVWLLWMPTDFQPTLAVPAPYSFPSSMANSSWSLPRTPKCTWVSSFTPFPSWHHILSEASFTQPTYLLQFSICCKSLNLWLTVWCISHHLSHCELPSPF